MARPQLYEDRKTREQLICLLQQVTSDVYGITVYDPVRGTWERLSPFPYSPGIPYSCKLVSVNRKLLLIGGWHRSNGTFVAVKSVFIYDFQSAKWRRGADMPTLRIFFACSACSSTGLVYVAGGHEGDRDYGHDLASAEVYNVEEDNWGILPPMTEKRLSCEGVFIDGKFMVISGLRTWLWTAYKGSAEVFDPKLGSWSMLEDMWSSQESLKASAFTAFSGQLYVFRGQNVMKYDAEKNVWSPVSTVPHCFSSFLCAAQWGDRIFVNGIARGDGRPISYLFQPSTGQSIAVDGGEDFGGKVLSAATIDI